MRNTLVTIGFLAGLALLVSRAEAGGVRGRVVDADGKGIPDATVVLDDLESGMRFECRTNEKGEYVQVGLNPGPYRITVTKEGYKARALQARIGIEMATDIDRIELPAARDVSGPQRSVDDAVHAKFARGVELIQAGQLDEAAAVFEEILALQPGIVEVHRNLGYIYVQKEDWSKAEPHFLAAIELQPEDADLVTTLVTIYEKSGQEEKAKEWIERAARDKPGDATAQFNLGISMLREGRKEEAIGAFEAALAADPPSTEAHYYLGTLLVEKGDVPGAVGHLESYLASDPQNAQNAATAQGLLEALKE